MPWIKEIQYFNDVHIPTHRSWTRLHRLAHGEKAARRLVRRAEEGVLDMLALHRITSIATEPVSDEWYGRIFASAKDQQICGEVTPEYSLLPLEGIEHVRRLNPRLKIIFLMRDPVDRCWSHLRMLMSRDPGMDVRHWANQSEVIARSDYPNIISRWISIFGHAQLFIANYEEVSQSPQRLIAKVSEFLGVPTHPATLRRAPEVVFPGRECAIPAEVRALLRARLDEVYRRLCEWQQDAADSALKQPDKISWRLK